MIEFCVPAVPVAQPRQRVAVIAGHARTYTPAAHPVNAFKVAAQQALADVHAGPPLDGPMILSVLFVLPRPKSKTTKRGPNVRYPHTGKPDLDNLLKSLMDGLSGLAWLDDKQVSVFHATKVVASGDERPHVDVIIKPIA
jgi:Holliday junction resolvase RusA-like endonuclease